MASLSMKAGPTVLPKGMQLFQKAALGVGVLAIIVLLAAFFGDVDKKTFFEAYLLGYVFWTGIAAGSLALMMLHHLTGGGWGFSIQRILESSARNLPLMLVLALPILIWGLEDLYLWAQPGITDVDHMIHQKAVFLNKNFFIGRVFIYFAVWIALSFLINHWSSKQDESPDGKITNKIVVLSAPGLIAFILTVTFFAIDFMMSLDPHWFSSLYGVMVLIGMGLSSFTFSILVLRALTNGGPLEGYIDVDKFHDLGKLTFGFVMLWGYMHLSQFLIIWSANLPEETTWYLARIHEGWQPYTVFVVVFHFAVPFLLLLTRHTKRNSKWLATIAFFILAMRLADLYWMIVPEAHWDEATKALTVHHIHFHWLFLVTPVAIGGIFLFMFFRSLSARALLPINDPRLEEALHGHH